MAATPYRIVTIPLAIGEEKEIPFPTDYVALISATDDDAVTVRLSDEGTASPLLVGLIPDRLKVPRFWIGNTSAAPNTVLVAIGSGASIVDNRQLNGSLPQDINLDKIAGASPIGQKAMAASLSVVVASDQSPVRARLAAVAALIRGQTAAMVLMADEVVIAAQGAGTRLHVHGLVVSNKHAVTATEIVIKDGAAEIFRVWAPVNTCYAITLPAPIRLSDNAALNAANLTVASDTRVAAFGFVGD